MSDEWKTITKFENIKKMLKAESISILLVRDSTGTSCFELTDLNMNGKIFTMETLEEVAAYAWRLKIRRVKDDLRRHGLNEPSA